MDDKKAEWAAIEQHLDVILDLPQEPRETYLLRLDHEQPEIAAALRELLVSHQQMQAESFLEGSLPAITGRDEIGTRIGAYTISALIGRGGMGEVWLAQRSDGRFEGQFAVKFLDLYAASPAALDRFQREGSLLARLAHPHIARLIDAGVTQSNRPYLVLDYVQGEPIDVYCRAHSLSVKQRVCLLLDVLAALAHAHSNLVIHRDIKPSNILVSSDGQVKLLDFGIAKLLSADPLTRDTPQLTRMEDTAFTPEYAAPEQILGDMPSTATDVYQVGVLMYALLADGLPLSSTGTRAERIKAALELEPQRLSDVASPERRAALRGDLDAIASKALRKLPHERYATASGLAEDLRRYLNLEPVSARADLLGYRIRKFVLRYRVPVIAGSVAVLALIAVTGFALVQMHQARLQRDRVREQARRAEKQAEFVTLMMSTVGSKPTTAEQLLDAGAKLVNEHYTADPQFRVTAMTNLSARYNDLGLTQKQYTMLKDANQIALQLNDQSLIAQSECNLSGVEMQLSHLDKANSLLSAGRERLSKVANPDPQYVEDCLEAQAALLNEQGSPMEAIRVDEQALAMLQQQSDATHDMHYADLLGRISDFYKTAGDSRRGFEYSERALEASEQSGLGDTDDTMIAIHDLASSLMAFGEVKAACEREKQLIDHLSSSGRSIITAMSVLYGTCLVRFGHPADSLAWYDRGLKSAQDEDDANLQLYALQNHARGLIELHRFAEAAADLERVEQLAKAHQLSGKQLVNRALLQQADLLIAQQRYDQARQLVDTLWQTVSDPSKGLGYVRGPVLLRQAKIALAQGRLQDASELSAKLLSEYQRRARDVDASADVGEALLMVARCKQALHDDAAAHEAARRAVIALTASLGVDSPLTKAALALQ
jgi:hypothetical protein